MPPPILRFTTVGALGSLVQLTSLVAFNHLHPHHVLLTSTAALELTLLHNLTWHIHYTWRDRAYTLSRLQQILRFHLTNGSISLLGNLAIMRLLVHHAHVPVVPANALSIACCALANFLIANHWIFPMPTQQLPALAHTTAPASGRSASIPSHNTAPHNNSTAIGTSGRS